MTAGNWEIIVNSMFVSGGGLGYLTPSTLLPGVRLGDEYLNLIECDYNEIDREFYTDGAGDA